MIGSIPADLSRGDFHPPSACLLGGGEGTSVSKPHHSVTAACQPVGGGMALFTVYTDPFFQTRGEEKGTMTNYTATNNQQRVLKDNAILLFVPTTTNKEL